VDEVTDFEVDPFKLERQPHAGSRTPGRPAAQDFWVARAAGTDAATLRWDVHDGDLRLVLMRADARPGVAVDGDVGVTLDHVATVAWVLLGVGALLMVGGLTTIGVAVGRGRR
jgi:hypothetical protein